MSDIPNGPPEDPHPPSGTGQGRNEEPPREPGWPEEAGVRHDTEEAATEELAPEEAIAAKISDLENRWRRALADLDNYRKRAVRELEREGATERARTSAEWLPVLDNLERALEHAEADPSAVIEGVRAVLDQAQEVIARLGFPRREDEGTPFDPTRHEAVGVESGTDAPEGTVVRVIRPGYGGRETQLRPAQVVVAKGRDDGAVP